MASAWSNKFVQESVGYRRYLRLGSTVVALRLNRIANLTWILSWREKRKEQAEISERKEYCNQRIEV